MPVPISEQSGYIWARKTQTIREMSVLMCPFLPIRVTVLWTSAFTEIQLHAFKARISFTHYATQCAHQRFLTFFSLFKHFLQLTPLISDVVLVIVIIVRYTEYAIPHSHPLFSSISVIQPCSLSSLQVPEKRFLPSYWNLTPLPGLSSIFLPTASRILIPQWSFFLFNIFKDLFQIFLKTHTHKHSLTSHYPNFPPFNPGQTF